MSRAVLISLLAVSMLAGPTATAAAPLIEPSELTKRTDLLGQEISVDDRVALFLFHQGRDFDEITLKRTTVLFRLPPRLRYRQSPGVPAVRLTGVLKREGDQWVCDVNAIELFPKDLVRLNRGVAILPPGEFEKRTAWAAWGERRGREFRDEELLKRALEIEVEAIRFEAESRSTDPPQLWIRLAQRARAHGVPEPEPSALAHRSFRARLETAKGAQELTRLVKDISGFFADPASPVSMTPDESASWDTPYAKNPAEAYRTAPSPVRNALDHRLWADATQRLLERNALDEPENALKLAEQAANQLPDRPKVAEALFEAGMKNETRRLPTLRLSEAKTLASVYRDRLHRPDRARDLLRSWLDEQRDHQMSPTDAEGRIALSNLYEDLIQDSEAAVELLQNAWRIDPQSKELAEAFRRRGFRKVNDEWVEPNRTKPRTTQETADFAETEPAPQSRKLSNLSPSQVLTLLGGKPNRVIFSGSQGQLVEQWIYFGAKQDQYINFLRTAGSDTPRVVAYYSLPKRLGSSHP